MSVAALTFLLDRQVQLELCRQLLLAVQPVREVNSPDPTVCVDLNPQRLHVVGPVGSSGEVGQVELDLIPAFVQPHRHRADEGLHSGGGLVVTRSESSPDVLIIQDLDLECEIFLHVLHDHDEVGQLDAQRLLRVRRAGHVGGADVRPDDLQDERLEKQ